MPHPCALIEEGMRGFEACELGAAAHAADKVLGEAPAGTIATLKETLVANAPVTLANGDAVEIAAHDLADLLGGVAVADLGGGAVDEGCVPAQLRHARFEAGTGARAGEEKEHGQRLVA